MDIQKKIKFLKSGELGVLHFIARRVEGICVFKVLQASFPSVFKYGTYPYGGTAQTISPASYNTTPWRFGGTFRNVQRDDIFWFDDVDTLIHAYLTVQPELEVFTWLPAGLLQEDYHDILSIYAGAPFGAKRPPVEFIVPPKIHPEFTFYNPYETETVTPYFRFYYSFYKVKYITDSDIIHDILQHKYRPLPKWFTLYGFKSMDYDFKSNMKISRPIPIDATKKEIAEIVKEWKDMGRWG